MFLQGEPFEKGSPSHPRENFAEGKSGRPVRLAHVRSLFPISRALAPPKSGQSGGNIPKKEEKRGQKRKKLKKYGD